MFPQSFIRAVLVTLTIICATTDGHTWVEQLSVIAPNGTMVGAPGFVRGNVLRSSSSFSDGAMVNLIPPNGGPANVIDTNQLMCKQSQTTQSQTGGSPRLSAAPGAMVALRYQENGHVTLPQNQPGKPTNRGTNFVYYTTQSQPTDKFLAIHRQWTADGSGGDRRGWLISTQNFDDGQCYQVNNGQISTQRQTAFKHTASNLMGADLWCQQDIQIPADAKAGTTITLYWVWDWPTMPGTSGQEAGKQELYTTCMDIDIVAGSGVVNKAAVQAFVKQDFVSAAASSQFTDIANPTAVASPQTFPFSGATGATTTGATASSMTASSRVKTSSNSVVPFVTLSPSASSVVISSATASVSDVSTANESSFSGSGQGRGSGRPGHSGQAGATVTVYKTDFPASTSADSIATPKGTSDSIPQFVPIAPEFTQTIATIEGNLTSSLATSQAESIVTRTQVDMITRTHYNTITARGGESKSTSTLIPTPSINLMLSLAKKLTTSLASSSPSSTVSTTCSKHEAIYRLRARMPFYVLPHDDTPSTGC